MPGEHPGDDAASGPPPHPLDRPWLHPSELFAHARQADARARPHRRARDLALALAAGGVAAVAVVLLLAATGVLDRRTEPVAARPAAEATAVPIDAAALADTAGRSVVAVDADGRAQASGVCLRDRHVVTTAAAVHGAASIVVTTPDGEQHDAVVAGVDLVNDLAVLRVEGLAVEPAQMTDDEVEVGQWVIAVGRHGPVGPWVTTGVVASLGGWVQDQAGARRPGMISTDAGTPEVAAGGALLDRRGRVVGVLAGSDPAGSGIATPSTIAWWVAERLALEGEVRHATLGVTSVDDARSGARIVTVAPGSAADDAGLHPDDVVLAVGGEPVGDTAALVTEIRRREPRTRVLVKVSDGERTRTLAVILDDAGADTGTPATTVPDPVAAPIDTPPMPG